MRWVIGVAAAVLLLGTAAAGAEPSRKRVLHVFPVDAGRGDGATAPILTTERLLSAPARGVYLLVDVDGVVGRVRITSARRGDRARAPRHAELALIGDATRDPTRSMHLVAVGPIAANASAARLMRLGLALAGRVVGELEPETLGVSPPGDHGADEIEYAIDLDGDDRADLASFHVSTRGNVVGHELPVSETAETWRRTGRRWARIERQKWTRRVLIGP